MTIYEAEPAQLTDADEAAPDVKYDESEVYQIPRPPIGIGSIVKVRFGGKNNNAEHTVMISDDPKNAEAPAQANAQPINSQSTLAQALLKHNRKDGNTVVFDVYGASSGTQTNIVEIIDVDGEPYS